MKTVMIIILAMLEIPAFLYLVYAWIRDTRRYK